MYDASRHEISDRDVGVVACIFCRFYCRSFAPMDRARCVPTPRHPTALFPLRMGHLSIPLRRVASTDTAIARLGAQEGLVHLAQKLLCSEAGKWSLKPSVGRRRVMKKWSATTPTDRSVEFLRPVSGGQRPTLPRQKHHNLLTALDAKLSHPRVGSRP
jgi:hypothetical protein